MNDDEDDDIGWEEDGDQQVQVSGEDVAWEDDRDRDEDGGGHEDEGDGGESPADFEIDDEGVDEEPEERRWLGDDGEIVVELPREEEEEDGNVGDHGGDGGNGGEHGDGEAGGKGKGKAKTKPRRFTAEETRQALDIHKAHLACLVARCAMVSRWASDPTVQAAMVSCLPGHLLSKKSVPLGQRAGANKTNIDQEQEEEQGNEKLTLVNLVVWFRGFITVLDDAAVGGGGGGGGGGEGSRGSRPQRLLRVIEQRAGCAQEAAQLFVSLCRGLGLRARYVACLDPVPPSPCPAKDSSSSKPRRQTWDNTVDLTAAQEGRRGGRKKRHQKRHMGRGASFGAGQVAERGGAGAGAGAGAPQAWAEVLCRDDGRELYVVAEEEDEGYPSGQPPPPRPSASPRRPSKRHRASRPPPPLPPGPCQSVDKARTYGNSGSEPLSLNSGEEGSNAGAAGGEGLRGRGNRGKRRRTQRGGKQPSPPPAQEGQRRREGASKDSDAGRPEEGKTTGGAAAEATAAGGATARPTRSCAKKTVPSTSASASAAPAPGTTRTTATRGKAGSPRKGVREDAASALLAAETVFLKGGKGGAGDDSVESAANPVGGVSAAGADGGGATVNGVGEDSSGSGKRGSKSTDARCGAVAAASSAPGVVKARWVHVDPVRGAVDQADKVQNLRFRKRLMPYVVAEDEKERIVDVTRRYSSDWARTLRTRGRAMASADGWWNKALRQWGASSADERRRRKTKQVGTGTSASPLVLEAEEKDGEAVDDPRASEERELQEKVNKEPIPSTIAALKNHHMYVLGKNLLKFEALRPGAKAAGLVKGSKVYLKSDVAKLRGASRWKKDSLQVKEGELGKPVKIATKKGEKDGEGTSKLYGEWQTEPWVPKAAVDGKVPKNEYGNVEFFDCSPAFLPPGTEHVRGNQIGRVAAKLGVDYAPALTGFESKQGRQVPVLDGIIVCKEQSQMLREAYMTWEQTLLEKQVKARGQKVLRRWRTLFQGVLLGAQLLEEYGDHK
eukprot:g10358.t1